MPPESNTSHVPNSADIDSALKEFEAQSNPKKDTEGVSFETDTIAAPKRYEESTVPKMVQLVIKYSGGAIKDERTAEYLLFGCVVVAMGISLLMFFKGSKPTQPSSAELEQMENMKIIHP